MKHFSREEALDAIALSIDAVDLPHPVRVGVDGVSASGKTVFADELCGILRGMGHNVIRAGVDGFHNPQARGPVSQGLHGGFLQPEGHS